MEVLFLFAQAVGFKENLDESAFAADVNFELLLIVFEKYDAFKTANHCNGVTVALDKN